MYEDWNAPFATNTGGLTVSYLATHSIYMYTDYTVTNNPWMVVEP